MAVPPTITLKQCPLHSGGIVVLQVAPPAIIWLKTTQQDWDCCRQEDWNPMVIGRTRAIRPHIGPARSMVDCIDGR